MSEDRNEVLKRYHGWLYQVAYGMVGLREGGQLAQDLAQEGYIAMWRALEKFDPERGAEPGWLTAAARMRMKDVRRGRPMFGHEPHRGTVTVEQGGVVEYGVAAEGDEELDTALIKAISVWLPEGLCVAYHEGQIWRAIGQLRPSEREYVVLRFWYGLTGREIAARTGVTESRVSQVMTSAKKALALSLVDLKAS